MIKHSMKTTFISAVLVLFNPAQAQMAPHSQDYESMKPPHFMPPQSPAPKPFTEFPTADELARMAPPEPMTEEKIKQRFAKEKAFLTKALDKDRQAAVKYAQDFSRYQKHQSDSLVKLMSRAEKRREQMLKRLEDREQQVLEHFRKRNSAPEKSSTPEAAR